VLARTGTCKCKRDEEAGINVVGIEFQNGPSGVISEEDIATGQRSTGVYETILGHEGDGTAAFGRSTRARSERMPTK
jgi:hypothetical protein